MPTLNKIYFTLSNIQPVTEKWPSAFDKRFIDWVIMNKKIKSYAAYYIKEWSVFIGIANKVFSSYLQYRVRDVLLFHELRGFKL